MPEVEEADIIVDEYLEKLFESITSVKRLSLCVLYNIREGYMYHDGIFFNQLEHLKLGIRFDYWSKLLFRLLQDSPKLRVLKLYVDFDGRFKKYEPISWSSDQSSVPECLLTSLETFEFAGYRGKPEERFREFYHKKCMSLEVFINLALFHNRNLFLKLKLKLENEMIKGVVVSFDYGFWACFLSKNN